MASKASGSLRLRLNDLFAAGGAGSGDGAGAGGVDLEATPRAGFLRSALIGTSSSEISMDGFVSFLVWRGMLKNTKARKGWVRTFKLHA
jgi:hypothetical protein